MSPLRFINQFSFLLTRHRFDGAFSFHRADAVRLRLDVNQFHRTSHFCITRAASGVMCFEASFRVGRPAGVERPIRTLNDIAITWHVDALFLFFLSPSISLEDCASEYRLSHEPTKAGPLFLIATFL